MSTRPICSALAAFTLAGCAFGQKFSYADSKVDVAALGPPRSAAVAVLDQRDYVRTGAKPESFVGLSRGGFGNPFDVTTTSGAPMAQDMAGAVVAALKAKGFEAQAVAVKPAGGPGEARQVLARTSADRLLLFTLVEWKSDSMARTGLEYDVTLEVLDRTGTVLATSKVKGKETADAGVLSAEPLVQGWFAAKVAVLLADEAVATSFR